MGAFDVSGWKAGPSDLDTLLAGSILPGRNALTLLIAKMGGEEGRDTEKPSSRADLAINAFAAADQSGTSLLAGGEEGDEIDEVWTDQMNALRENHVARVIIDAPLQCLQAGAALAGLLKSKTVIIINRPDEPASFARCDISIARRSIYRAGPLRRGGRHKGLYKRSEFVLCSGHG